MKAVAYSFIFSVIHCISFAVQRGPTFSATLDRCSREFHLELNFYTVLKLI